MFNVQRNFQQILGYIYCIISFAGGGSFRIIVLPQVTGNISDIMFLDRTGLPLQPRRRVLCNLKQHFIPLSRGGPDNEKINMKDALLCFSSCTNRPKYAKTEINQSVPICFSEYQTAFKSWPWQPIRPSLKPGQSNVATQDKKRAKMERKSTYGIDYVFQNNQKKVDQKRHKTDVALDCQDVSASDPTKPVKPKLKNHYNEIIIPSEDQQCHGDSMYKGDFIHHGNVSCPTAHRPIENTQHPTDPLEGHTEYKDFNATKIKNAHMCRRPGQGNQDDQHHFKAISTAMADFIAPVSCERQKPCIPPVSNRFIPARFDGRTTFSQAYKQWPITGYQLPIWAKKPKYKRPQGGFTVNSLYRHDYVDPKVIVPPQPICPKAGGNIVKHNSGDIRFESSTTYSKDYRLWENIEPPESYRMIEVYKSPREAMVCETNHRSDYKGEPSPKMKPSRLISQYRDLNTNVTTKFVTTYSENFQSPRPKSTPYAAAAHNEGIEVKPRSCSAKNHYPTPASTSTLPIVQSIPRPDLSAKQKQASIESCEKIVVTPTVA